MNRHLYRVYCAVRYQPLRKLAASLVRPFSPRLALRIRWPPCRFGVQMAAGYMDYCGNHEGRFVVDEGMRDLTTALSAGAVLDGRLQERRDKVLAEATSLIGDACKKRGLRPEGAPVIDGVWWHSSGYPAVVVHQQLVR